MPQEEFLKCLGTAAKFIRASDPFKTKIGLGSFLMMYDKHKHEVFSDFALEFRDSSSFQCLVYQMMAFVKYLDAINNEPEMSIPDNVVNFNDYKKNMGLRAVI